MFGGFVMAVYANNSTNAVSIDTHECVDPKNDNILNISKDKITIINGKQDFSSNEIDVLFDIFSKTVYNLLVKKGYTLNVNFNIRKLSDKEANKPNV